MSYLASFKDNRVSLITTDGRFFLGTLASFDLSTNIVLTDAAEVLLADPNDADDETQIVPLGVYFVRGDCVVCCGLNDETLESNIDWKKTKGEPLKSTKLKI